MTERRRELLAGLGGEVVEVGAGHGVTFANYPAEVTRVVAVEPEPCLRARAAAAETAVPVDVVPGVAEHLPVADASVDAVAFCMVLCSLPDVGAALTAEAAIRGAGFRVDRLDRFLFSPARTPFSFHLLGTALRDDESATRRVQPS